jgi:fatty acyl-CoA reductase
MSVDEMRGKLHFIGGDCEHVGLLMSEEDRKFITETVTFVFHFAATVRFDEKMKKAVEMNTRGTREVLKLGIECKKLEMFAHMSTAYCHLNVPFLLEKVRQIINWHGQLKFYLIYFQFSHMTHLQIHTR